MQNHLLSLDLVGGEGVVADLRLRVEEAHDVELLEVDAGDRDEGDLSILTIVLFSARPRTPP